MLRERELKETARETGIKELENKELISSLLQVIDIGAKLHGAYKFGNFLGKVGYMVKKNIVKRKNKNANF